MNKIERDARKRRAKPTPLSALLDFDVYNESSDDSDFRIEDCCEESDDSSHSDEGGNQDDYDDPSENEEASLGTDENKMTVEELLTKANLQKEKIREVDPVKILICCVCLGESSDANNEIVECDSCGVTVHEVCYGISENDSVSSTVSNCSTAPWFCETCRAGVDNPTCELCPNSGGIFKETDTEKWVHLVCALYIPGVVFREVDKLSCVTLFEMSYSKWSARACSLCHDQRLTVTGVCISCDAGLCNTYFHVTCGQREGLLSEGNMDEADPFYGHCRLHSDKFLLKKRRHNWLALEFRVKQRKKQYAEEGYSKLPAQVRIQRELAKYRQKYVNAKITRSIPWVPTQKMSRMLTSSASACKSMFNKASMSGVDTQAWAFREAQIATLADIHRKWHIPPAFSVEFIGYYLDRNNRLKAMKQHLSVLLNENSKLLEEQQRMQYRYDEALKENTLITSKRESLKIILQKYCDVILKVAPQKKLLNLQIGKPITHTLLPLTSPLRSVSTPAALRAEFGFPLSQTAIRIPLNYECGICKSNADQHLLAKCDTCLLHYHIGCVHPPLTRMPKKTKLMGWQCSECDKESSGSEIECLDPEAPRQLRKHKDLSNVKITPPSNQLLGREKDHNSAEAQEAAFSSHEPIPVVTGQGIKQCQEKHHCYSLDTTSTYKQQQNLMNKNTRGKVQKTLSSLKTSKYIPNPTGEGSAYSMTAESAFLASPLATAKKPKEAATILVCHKCNLSGTNANIVKCDECLKGYHFHCLDPPVKKSPKARGYFWHCTECDPTESDSS